MSAFPYWCLLIVMVQVLLCHPVVLFSGVLFILVFLVMMHMWLMMLMLLMLFVMAFLPRLHRPLLFWEPPRNLTRGSRVVFPPLWSSDS